MAFKATETNEIKMEVKEKCGVFHTDKNGRTFEVRLIAWNGKPAKYDIRQWYTNEDGTEGCGKGITLTCDQITGLAKLLSKLAK